MLSRRLFLLTYGGSGVAALIYEVTWTRMLTLQIGHSTAATSTVLSAFMGGLAIGSAVGGRCAGRLSPAGALRAYSGLEVAIAALALLLPFGLASLQPLLVTLYADGSSGVMFPLFRLFSSLLLVSLPAAAMGASFPVASRWFVQRAASAAGDAGRLYAVNTIGAAVGALLAGFALLPALGLRRTIWTGVSLNLTAAISAWLIARYAVTLTPTSVDVVPVRARRTKTATTTRGLGILWIAAVAFGLSGFASLALQVVWTRLLASIVGPTTYAFSLIVAVFIGGLAAGSALAARFASRLRHPVLALSSCLLSSVALALAAAACVDWALLAMAQIAANDLEFGEVLARQTLLVTALLVPMAVAFGAVFPLAVAVGTKVDRAVVADLGLIYALNTAAAIVGALLAGFVLIPLLGLYDTIRCVTVVVALGAFLLVGARVVGRSRLVGFAACGLVVVLAFTLRPWNEALLSSGVYTDAYARMRGGPDLKISILAGRLLYYREGAAATVAVREAVGSRSLSIDGKVDASNAGDMLTQRLLAHLPLLLHAEPRQIAIIGLGSGVTLGSALKHPVARADVLEISPEVVEASRSFERENHRALADARTRLIIGDGRSHLMLTRMQYDVIISEPSNPWMAGIASLFTREFFQSARSRLASGGLLCQWAHTYNISDDDLRSIVATFLSVFPDGTLWLVGDADVLLVGSTGPLRPRLDELGRHWERDGVESDLRDIGVREPFALLSLFVAEGPDLARYAAGAPLQTDDLGGLEFSGPRGVFGRQIDQNADILKEVGRKATVPEVIQTAIAEAGPRAWQDRGWMLLRAEAYDAAWHDFARAVEMDPTDANAYSGLIRAAVATTSPTRVHETLTRLRQLAVETSSVEAMLAVSRLLAAQGAIDEAVGIGFDLAKHRPDDFRVLEQLASVLADAGDIQRLQPVVLQLRQVAPASEATHYYVAALFFMQGRPDLSVSQVEPVVRENPNHALAQNLLGAALASLGDRERARHAFEASLRADPLAPGTYSNLATLELQAGNPLAAARRFAEALTLDPTSEAARRGLAEATARR